MTLLEKIELFNELQSELQGIYGEFDTIDIVDEYPEDIRVDTDGTHYYDTDGCMESTPYCIAVKRSEFECK